LDGKNMRKINLQKILLVLIAVLAFGLRFYKLGEVPLGFHQDEISQSYNSFSMLKTGEDRYGQFMPILFRSFGSYQPPIYTYLTPIPLYLFGNTIFAARSTSAFFGVLTVLISYFIVKELVKNRYKESLALLTSFVVAISPWAIHFSRRVVEGNLGLFFFLLSFYFFIRSLSQIKFIIPASILLGISTHAYYSERLIAVIFLPFFLIYFKDYFLKYKKWVICGILLFGLTLLPHVITVFSGAFAARLDQVGTAGNGFLFFIEFLKHFVGYLSPLYLFSDAGNGLARVSPNLGVFYSWLCLPFITGLYYLSELID
jgi:4-amino-4-deoxy-L-arabinose transferase-like glycosyltransferase